MHGKTVTACCVGFMQSASAWLGALRRPREISHNMLKILGSQNQAWASMSTQLQTAVVCLVQRKLSGSAPFYSRYGCSKAPAQWK